MTLLRTLTLGLVVVSLAPADDLTDDLLAAARKGDLAKVKALLDKGASVNSKSPYGSTPLFFACDRGYLEIATLLIDRGADVNVEDTFYHATALTWAMQNNHPAVLKLLLEHGAKSPALVVETGAQEGKPELVRIGLAKGPIDKSTLSKALAAATASKNTEIVELLKAAGAEPVKTVELDAATLESYAGTFTGSIGGTELEMTFTVKGPALSGALVGQPALTYAASDKTHFHSVEIAGVDIEFKDAGFTLKQGPAEIAFKRKAVQK